MFRPFILQLVASLFLTLALTPTSFGATARVLFTQANIIYTDDLVGDDPLTDRLGAPLAVGTPFQLGFFDGISTALDPAAFGSAEWATFTPITGEGSLNPSLDTRFDQIAGLLSASIVFNACVHQGIPRAPDPGVLIGLRFFDQLTVAEATHYNTVTATSWILKPGHWPPQAPVTLSMDESAPVTLVWESGDAGFATTIPSSTNIHAPEPSSILLGLLGLSLARGRRR